MSIDLDRHKDVLSGTPLQESYHQLMKDICTILGDSWEDTPVMEIKERFNRAIAQALRIAI